METVKVLLIYNASDRRCGYQNFGTQMAKALIRAGVDVTVWDGTYSVVYARGHQLLPSNVHDYDLVHIIWHAMTMNHYNGADWTGLKTSIWEGGPSDAYCPFLDAMQIRWSDYPRQGFRYLDYPVVDWIDDLPPPASTFTVGASSVRGDGVGDIIEICEQQGWATNLPDPTQWLSAEDEIRRLAKSTINVCWYRTPPIWKNHASAPSTLLAAKRPLLINHDLLVEHLHDAPDLYHETDLPRMLKRLEWWQSRGLPLKQPLESAERLSWTRAVDAYLSGWGA